MHSEDYVNGFRQAVLCLNSFWDNIDMYYVDNPRIRHLDKEAKLELQGAMNDWADKYLNKVVRK